MGTINIPDQEERLEMGVVGMTPLEAFIEEHNETRAKFSKIEMKSLSLLLGSIRNR